MQNPAHAIFLPAAALAALTLLVWIRMFMTRLGEMRRLRIRPQTVSTSAQASKHFVDTRAADNFRNLFELPVLFYAALSVAFAIGAVNILVLGLAWAFVGLRVAHSAIQCSYNRVMHRFAVYTAGGLILWALWGVIAWNLLR